MGSKNAKQSYLDLFSKRLTNILVMKRARMQYEIVDGTVEHDKYGWNRVMVITKW